MEWIFGTEVNDLATARARIKGGGASNSSALGFGGISSPPSNSVAITESQVANTETWNGSTWTETGDLNRYTKECGGVAADNTAAIAIAGSKSGSPENDSRCESWNGSSWTETTEFNTGRARLGGAGINTATLIYGGDKNPSTLAGETEFLGNSESQVANTETWDGTNWTEIAEINEGRYFEQAAGTQTSALAFGGEPSRNQTESYDGTTFSEVNNLNNAREGASSAGTATSALFAGGYSTTYTPPTVYANTEFLGNSESQVANTETQNLGMVALGQK